MTKKGSQIPQPAAEVAIKVSNISKAFSPYPTGRSLKEILIHWRRRSPRQPKQPVLKAVSFTIKKGEFIGVVGQNGCGKSTLLKMIAGIYHPDQGLITVSGKLVSLIELGAGFQPELTGRDNVYLGGALIGLNSRQVSRIYEAIVDFAELKNDMDKKFKNFSSGMQVRLAFALVSRADGDIILIDEVLAVGDQSFQAKCIDHIKSLKQRGKTVVLVTHDLDSVVRLCDRALWFANNRLQMQGPAKTVVEKYKHQIKKQ